MKKKPILILAAAASLILALLLIGLPLFSRLYYGRSQAATLFAWQLKKEAFTSDRLFQEYLLEKKAENNAEYVLPQDTAACLRAVKSNHGGVTFYTLHGALPADGRVILYFPGGSYIDQPRKVHWEFLTRLADESDSMVVVPLYPKLPDHDAAASYAALTDAYTEFFQDMTYGELVFMGDSAGGGMALSFAMQLRDAGLRGPDRLILICPWLDVTLSNPDIPAYEKKDPALDSAQLRHLGELWAGDLSPTDPIVSPLYGSFEDLGEITLITGTAELLYPDIHHMGEMLDDAGIRHNYLEKTGMFHVWPLYLAYNIPETAETYADILDILSAPAVSPR